MLEKSTGPSSPKQLPAASAGETVMYVYKKREKQEQHSVESGLFLVPTEDVSSSGVVGCLLAELQETQNQFPQNTIAVFYRHAGKKPVQQNRQI